MSNIFGEKHKDVQYQVRKSVYAVIVNKGKDHVFAVQDASGCYFLPGGGIEAGESDVQCLEREMVEETGHQVVVESYIGNAKCYFQSRKKEKLLSDGFFYQARLLNKVTLEIDHEVKWLPVESMEKYFIFPHHIWEIKQMLQERFENER